MTREATAAEKTVFGADVQIGEDDKPIERGIGSLSWQDFKKRAQELAAETEAVLKPVEEEAARLLAAAKAEAAELLAAAEAEAAVLKNEAMAEIEKLKEIFSGTHKAPIDPPVPPAEEEKF